jgi:hypothetical protein
LWWQDHSTVKLTICERRGRFWNWRKGAFASFKIHIPQVSAGSLIIVGRGEVFME